MVLLALLEEFIMNPIKFYGTSFIISPELLSFAVKLPYQDIPLALKTAEEEIKRLEKLAAVNGAARDAIKKNINGFKYIRLLLAQRLNL